MVDDGEAGLVEVAAKRGEAVGVGGVDWPDEHGSSGNDRTHELTPLFDRAGFKLIEKGPIGGPRMIGVSSLRFVLMAAPPVDA